MKEMIEYIWDKPRVTVFTKKDGTEVKKVNENRQRKGVMVAFIPEGTNSVVIGVSLCCGIDKFDYKDGTKEKGFGLNIARQRAMKHADTDWIKIHGVTSIPQELRDQGDADGVWIPEVKIPASALKPLTNFVDRCRRYYKDISLPTWAELLSNEEVMGAIRTTIRENSMSLEKYYMGLGCEICLDEDCPGC